MYGKYKLKLLVSLRFLLYKLPQEIHESSGCSYPLWSMILISKGNLKKNIFTSLKYLSEDENIEDRQVFYITHHLSTESWSL